MKVIGLLLTFQRQSQLPGTLDLILGQSDPPEELLVVDNEDSPETRRIVETHAARQSAVDVRYCATPENLGSAGGWGNGMQRLLESATDSDWVLILDDDHPPRHREELQRMRQFLRQQLKRNGRTIGGVGIVGADFCWRTGRVLRIPDSKLSPAVSVDWLGNGHLAIYSVAAIRQVGPFWSDLFFGCTELEFGLRMRKAGFDLLANGDLWKERRAEKRDPPLPTPAWRRYYVSRNTVALMLRNGRKGAALRFTLLQAVVKPILALFTSRPQVVHRTALIWKGLRDGWAGRMGRTIPPQKETGHTK